MLGQRRSTAHIAVRTHTVAATRVALSLFTLCAAVTTATLATVTLTPAAPASAAPAPMDGYVWGWQPANPNYFPATGYEYNSAGGAIQILRPAVGTYQVRFLGMAGRGGVAHVSAYGSNHLCTVTSYGPSVLDEVVNIRCYDTAGAAVDTAFVANVTNRTDGGSHGYLWSSDPMPPAFGYTPPEQWSFDSAGQPIVVYRSGVGRYQVELGAFAQDSPALWASGYLRVTPYGAGAKHCQVLDPSLFMNPDLIEVRCYDDTGFGVDTRFTLTYSRKLQSASATVDLSGLAPVFDGWTNPGGAPTFTELGVGDYLVTFPGAAAPRGHVMAAMMGTPPMFCNIHAWWPSLGAEKVWIRCYDGGVGIPTPAMMLNVGYRA